MNVEFKKASPADAEYIWKILQDAIEQRRLDGSNQWQDGYPNPLTVEDDIQSGYAYVLTLSDKVIGYIALLINDEVEYENIKGKWLSEGDFVVYHRVAIAKDHLRQGWAEILLKFAEDFAIENNIYSLKADTSFDNPGMLRLFEKMGYKYCGEVSMRGSPRKAFEKVLKVENKS